jgi:hypothetical protein
MPSCCRSVPLCAIPLHLHESTEDLFRQGAVDTRRTPRSQSEERGRYCRPHGRRASDRTLLHSIRSERGEAEAPRTLRSGGRVVQRALQRAGAGSSFPLTRVDLEDELIRALGAALVEAVIDIQRELESFRTIQKPPVWRHQRVEAQLRRFMRSGATRKLRYALAGRRPRSCTSTSTARPRACSHLTVAEVSKESCHWPVVSGCTMRHSRSLARMRPSNSSCTVEATRSSWAFEFSPEKGDRGYCSMARRSKTG